MEMVGNLQTQTMMGFVKIVIRLCVAASAEGEMVQAETTQILITTESAIIAQKKAAPAEGEASVAETENNR